TSGTGSTVAQGGLQLGAADPYGHYLTLVARNLTNAGAAVWQGTGGYIYQQQAGTFTNQAGATLDIRNDLPWYSDGTATAFVNQGTLQKSAGTGTTELRPALSNSGTIDIRAGTLSLSGTFSNFSGTTLTG